MSSKRTLKKRKQIKITCRVKKTGITVFQMLCGTNFKKVTLSYQGRGF